MKNTSDYSFRILDILKEHPNGLRLRSIGAKLGVWHPSLVPTMNALEESGKVVAIPHRDMANMEFYYVWKLAEKKEYKPWKRA